MLSPTQAAAAALEPLLGQIEKLSAPERNVLRLKAMFAWASSKNDFQTVANRGQVAGPDGLAWTHKTLNAVLERLISLKLLKADFSCVEVLWRPLTVEFLAMPEGRKAAAAMGSLPASSDRGPYYSYALQTDTNFLRRLRLTLYEDAEPFGALMAKYDKAFRSSFGQHVLVTLFVATPLELDWLTGRALEVQLRLFNVKIDQLFLTDQAPPDVAALMAHYREKEGEADFKPFALLLLRCDMLAGRFAIARRKIDALTAEESKPFTAPLLRGTVDFFEGHNAEALTHYRLALGDQLWAAASGSRPAGGGRVAHGGFRRGAGDEERRDPPRPGRTKIEGEFSPGFDRHVDRKLSRRIVEPVQHRQSRFARLAREFRLPYRLCAP